MLKSWLFAVCLLVAGTAEAQSFKMPTIALAGAAAADWTTTYQFMNKGVPESNPMLSWVGKDRPGATVALGAAIDVAGVWAIGKFIAPKHPKIAKAILYGWAGSKGAAAAQNYGRHYSRYCDYPHIACNGGLGGPQR